VEGEAEVIIEWNQILQSNLPGSAGVFSFRYYAMMHIAMFDAINSIERDYERYHVQVPAGPTASAEAAAAQAAHDVLVALLPTATATFDAALKSRLAKIHWWRAAQGAAVGKKVAQAVLDWRTGDGFEQPDPPYLPPPIPGVWQGTPPGQVAAGVRFANVEPFGLLTATQYLPDPPPLLNSSEYATDFEQVKLLGSSTSASRTADQTLVAKLFAGPPSYSPNPFALWSNIARDLARSRHLSLIKTARLFALINAASNDGLQTAHTSKFVYGLWRPVTAINRADEDHNDATAPEPGWAPLLGTPPYPSHASNLTCIAASAARSLARTFRTDAIPFTVTWTGTGGVANETRSYASFSQLAEEAGLSRVYGGIHFLFELTESHESCKKVADYLFENYMRPKH
jgi:membrane-associated phospholipid phosphatase